MSMLSKTTKSVKSLWSSSKSSDNKAKQTSEGDKLDESVTDMKVNVMDVNPEDEYTKPVTIAIIGCGQRGKSYAAYAHIAPHKCKIVAIAEPRPKAREATADDYGLSNELVFGTWQELFQASAKAIETNGARIADAVLVTVQDSLHKEVVLAFAEQGYHILCEKPMATSLADCVQITEAVKKANIIFGMGHVLRYSPYCKAIAEIIASGELGRLINIQHIEPVGYFHFAHSYVRGNWNKQERSSFSLMTKSCHDIDIICSWLAPAAPTRASSFGSLQHFKKSEKPSEAGDATRCLECPIERECPYSAKKIYLDRVSRGHTSWPVSPIVDGVPDIENVTEALKTGPYGVCVYESDNDVADNQVVNLEFSNGATVSFTMIAHTSLICDRQTRLHFSHGEIVGDMSGPTVVVTDFRTSPPTTKRIHPANEGGGHGGGDFGLISSFVRAVHDGKQEHLGTTVEEVYQSHLCVFAAEKSRRDGTVVDVKKFGQEIWEQYASKD